MAGLSRGVADPRPHVLQFPPNAAEVSMIAVRMPRKSKYGAKPVVIDGIRFASTHEGKRYAELKLLAKAGEINGLELQPKLNIWIGGKLVFSYIADFSYSDRKTGKTIFEDAKGVRTPVYKLKKKIIEAHYGIEIVEI
jgi:hypothetical protein